MLILSNCLTTTDDEGCLKLAKSLVSRIKKANPETTVITYERESGLSDVHLNVNKLMLSSKLFSIIRSCNEPVLYIPFPVRTLATALRVFVVSLYTRKKLSVISVMKYHTNLISRILLRLSGADFVVFSMDAAEFYEKIAGKKRVAYLKTGVDTQKFVPVDNEKKIALKKKYGFDGRPVIRHVGHLNRGRNIAELMKFGEKYQILLVTSTLTKNEQDIELKNELLSKPNIRIIDDYIPNIEELYQLSDIYFFPVVEQGRCIDVPLSVMEAASCGKPIITTDYGEIKALINNDGFYRINSFDTESLSGLAEKALNSQSGTARKSALEYDWNNAVTFFINS